MNPASVLSLLLLASLSISVAARKLNVENEGRSCNFNYNTDADCTSDCAYCFLGSCFYFPKAINGTTRDTESLTMCRKLYLYCLALIKNIQCWLLIEFMSIKMTQSLT